MALVKCPECGKDVSTTAMKCPHCGFVPDMNPLASSCPEWPTPPLPPVPPPPGMSETEWRRQLAEMHKADSQKATNARLTEIIVIIILAVLFIIIAKLTGCLPDY